jgi:hypothetical protein
VSRAAASALALVALLILAALVAAATSASATGNRCHGRPPARGRSATAKASKPRRVARRASSTPGDTALDPTASSLAYGTASRVGGSECISRSDGITCVNRAGHGFFISVQSYQVF